MADVPVGAEREQIVTVGCHVCNRHEKSEPSRHRNRQIALAVVNAWKVDHLRVCSGPTWSAIGPAPKEES